MEHWKDRQERWRKPSGTFFVLVSEGDGGDWPASRYTCRPLHRHAYATQNCGGRMRAIAKPGYYGNQASVCPVCSGQCGGDCECAARDSGGIERSRGRHLGTAVRSEERRVGK